MDINEFFTKLIDKDPIIVVLVIGAIFLAFLIYSTRASSRQNSEDHKEKELLIDLIKNSNNAFNDLKGAIDSLKVSQDTRNESIRVQIEEQKHTNKNLNALNDAFAIYHSGLTDTITVILKNQLSARLDNVESIVKDILDAIKNKPDCDDEVLGRLNDLGKDVEMLKDYIIKGDGKNGNT